MQVDAVALFDLHMAILECFAADLPYFPDEILGILKSLHV